MPHASSRGMIQVAGITYRVVRIEAHRYAAVRLSDDVEVGRFQTRPVLSVQAVHVEPTVLFEVARRALRAARLSSVGHAPPPAPRSVTPAPRSVTPAPRSVTPAPRSVTPTPTSSTSGPPPTVA